MVYHCPLNMHPHYEVLVLVSTFDTCLENVLLRIPYNIRLYELQPVKASR